MTDIFTPRIGEPETLTAGDSWAWRRDDLSVYAVSPDGFVLSYAVTPETGGAAVTITATADSAGFLVSVAPASTIAFAPGRHTWRAMLTRPADGARASVGLGSFKIEPDPATSTADTRSTARRTLAAIEARIEGRITKDAESYTIEGRSISRTPLEILEKLVGIYRAKVRREDGGSVIRVNKVAFK